LWVAGVAAAVIFAFAFHFLIDEPIQNRIKAEIKARQTRRRRVAAVAGAGQTA
jgi:peptidoglycan/LPS O-acetylase OafA/YrhL